MLRNPAEWGRQPRRSRLWQVGDRTFLHSKYSPTKLRVWGRTTGGVPGLLWFISCYGFSFWFLQLAWSMILFWCLSSESLYYKVANPPERLSHTWQRMTSGMWEVQRRLRRDFEDCGVCSVLAGTRIPPLSVKRDCRLLCRERKVVAFLQVPN